METKVITRDREYGEQELIEINIFRKEMGMREIVPSNVECIRCGKNFKSCDPTNVRFCHDCKFTLIEEDEWETDGRLQGNMLC